MPDALDIIEHKESAGRNVPNYKYGPGFTASGHFQMINSTWRRWAEGAGIDISKWPRAIDAPYDVQRAVAKHGYETEGFKPWEATKNLIGREKDYAASLTPGTQTGGTETPGTQTTGTETPQGTLSATTTPPAPAAPAVPTFAEAYATASKPDQPQQALAAPVAPPPVSAPAPAIPDQTHAADLMASLLTHQRSRYAPDDLEQPQGILNAWA